MVFWLFSHSMIQCFWTKQCSHIPILKHKDHMSALSWKPQFHLLSKVNERSKFVWLEVYINLPDNFLSDVKDSSISLTNTN